MGKTALVTGASSGIGKATALALRKAGYTVFGTSRKPENVGGELDGIRFLPLELLDAESIDTLVSQLPALDVLITCAASSLMSAVENTPVSKIKELFELIVFGNLRLIQGVLPAMRAAGHGLIVNISSYAAVTPVPCSAIYAGAKAALHVVSNGLRQEVRPFGIRVVTVAPTFIKTPIYQERLCDDSDAYGNMIKAVGAIRDQNIASGTDPEIVAKKILNIMKKKNPASFYPVGKNALTLSIMQRVVPEAAREAIVRKRFGL